MSEYVRVDLAINALAFRPIVDACLYGAWAQASTPLADKNSGFVGSGHLSAKLLPARDCFERVTADRDNSFLVGRQI